MKNNNKWIIAGLASFLFPLSIIFIILLSMGIYYNSDKTILASDAFHQYVIFAQNFRNIMHGSDSFFLYLYKRTRDKFLCFNVLLSWQFLFSITFLF